MYVSLAHNLEGKSFEILAKRLCLSVYTIYSSSFAQTHNIEPRLANTAQLLSILGVTPLIFPSGVNLPLKLSLHLDADLHCPLHANRESFFFFFPTENLSFSFLAFLHNTDNGLPTRKQTLFIGLGKEFDCIYSVFYLRNMPVIF